MTQRMLTRLIVGGCVAVVLMVCGEFALAAAGGDDAAAAPAKVRTPHEFVYIVYLNPADRECLPNYQERLDRVMTTIQTWYRDEMVRNGFGAMTFPLERDEDGKLVIHVVRGTRAYAQGEEITTGEMRDVQVKPALLKEGIDVDQEHIIILANGAYVTENDNGDKLVYSSSHYVGSGNHRSGAAWVTDYEFLDPLNLEKKEPAVFDGGTRRYTLGHYMVTYIGGIAHEFGHALGLPHNMETEAQFEELGYTLMGSGNYHFLAKRAGDEKESYLSKAHATILSSHPLFRRDTTDIDVRPVCKWHDIEFASGDGEYVVSGRVESVPRAYAVVAYHDLTRHAVDYDATSWVGTVGDDGRFEVRVGALKPGVYELRLKCYFVNGDKCELSYQFPLDDTFQLPVEDLKRQTLCELYVKPAIEARDPDALLLAINSLKTVDDIYTRRAQAYHRLMTRERTRPQPLGALGDDVREVQLSTAGWESASVGWERPMRDRIPDGAPLESGKQFYEFGLYAHADSSYVYNLEGKWERFTAVCGLQNEVEGSVVFAVKCDGKEVFRSDLINDWTEVPVDLDVTGVRKLELIATDGGDGKWADCSVWFAPTVTR
ncbi:MAG: NPCBM/NEW2 domain-containing protein [Verrucomicrobia bacterium]|nr:NPCBM/NEW2 domain-containing protein [Verrucomicrobiota bacterium]